MEGRWELGEFILTSGRALGQFQSSQHCANCVDSAYFWGGEGKDFLIFIV